MAIEVIDSCKVENLEKYLVDSVKMSTLWNLTNLTKVTGYSNQDKIQGFKLI